MGTQANTGQVEGDGKNLHSVYTQATLNQQVITDANQKAQANQQANQQACKERKRENR